MHREQPIELDEARRRIAERARALGGRETVDLLAALGRVLADDAVCGEPWPTTDRSAMDGFALAASGDVARAGTRFRVVGEALAGRPYGARLVAGEAVRIMTGGVVPGGADRVAKVEDTSGFAGELVELQVDVPAGENVRPRGSEVAPGTAVVRGGTRIRAAEIAALAVLGQARVEVLRRPTVAILSTGDEVVDVGAEPAVHQIRDSNSWALAAKVLECGGLPERLGIVADEPQALRAALARGLEADVLVTIGGVSAGTHDLVPGTLAELGVETVFHGLRLKPGKPAFFGLRTTAGRTSRVFGLPGNPASAFTTFDLLVAPLLQRLGGAEPAAELVAAAAGVRARRDRRTQAVPARLCASRDGGLRAELTTLRPSGDPFGLVDADGYALVPADTEPGATCAFVAYSGALGMPRG